MTPRAARPSPTAAPARVRPVDAAGLVLLRDGRHGPEVLLGRRHRRVTFLPDIYVFPGGRVDPEDARPSGFPERIQPGLEELLGPRGRPPAAFLRAALRETLEETGLLLGRPAEAVPGGPHRDPWRLFAEHGLAPGFDALQLVCRAITPTSSHRRYNTRFFLADGSAAQGTLGGSGELEDLRWFPIAETTRLGLVDVTQVVLAESLRRWRQGARQAAAPPPLLTYRGDQVCLRRPGRPLLVGEAAVLGGASGQDPPE